MKAKYDLDLSEEILWLDNYFRNIELKDFSDMPFLVSIHDRVSNYLVKVAKEAFELGIEYGERYDR